MVQPAASAKMAATSSSHPVPPAPSVVVPAQLGFLAIFNPSLGTTDDTIDDQIVYYASVAHQGGGSGAGRGRRRRGARPTDGISHEERNERLRQIGLAQGMVEFSRGFANRRPVDTIETEKARVVLRELEPGWWILASIDLTKLPLPPRLGAAAQDDTSENVEYSSREVKPATLLLQDLLRAHSVFLLHHAASLSALFVRSKRSRFITMLSRYWDLFLSTWNVMLHGNPACAVLGGIKVAACGELGFGVGEEERGSGEREVLEGFVDRVEGLVDLVVSKFGEPVLDKTSDDRKSDVPKWLGTGEEPGAEDGAIFLGVGSLSRKSLRDITNWMEDLYTWGEDAYGVKDSPTSTRIKTKRQRVKSMSIKNDGTTQPAAPPGTQAVDHAKDQNVLDGNAEVSAEEGRASKFVSYLKLGYGTHWSLGGNSEAPLPQDTSPDPESTETRPSLETRRSRQHVDDDTGHYLIGLQGDVEERDGDTTESDPEEMDSRTLLRTLTVELEGEAHALPEEDRTQDLGSGDHELATTRSGYKDPMDPNSNFDSQDRNKTKKMRVVVYVSKPFIYTFLFKNRTDSLAWDSLYKSLHYQLEPLRRPLTLSTSYRPDRPDVGVSASNIFDLIWDPQTLTIHSTIPNIPDPISMRLNPKQQILWSRTEAMNTHMQILSIYTGTREDLGELERTCKTNRGWWVVWTRILETKDNSAGAKTPPQVPSGNSIESNFSHQMDSTSGVLTSLPTIEDGTEDGSQASTRRRRRQRPRVSKEIFLIRRAGESGNHARSISSPLSDGVGRGWADGASRLAQGIGVDTKKYIETLLSLGQ